MAAPAPDPAAADRRGAHGFGRGLIVLLGGEGIARGLSFLAIWGVAHRLGSDAYAPVAVALAALMFASLAVEMGFPLFGSREIARDPARAGQLLGPALATQLAVAALLVGVAVALARGGACEPDLAALLPVYAASLLVLPFLAPWVFQGLGRMEWVAAPNVLRQAALLVASWLLVRSPADVTKLPWAEVAAVATAVLLAQVGLRRLRLSPRPDLRGAFRGELLRGAVPMGASQFLWVLRMYLATLMIWGVLPRDVVPRASVSRYDVAHRIMMVLQALLTMYFTNLYPALARATLGPRRELFRVLLRSLAGAGGVALLAAFVAPTVCLPLLRRFLGADFADDEAARCLARLVFVIPVLAARGHARMTLLALGRERLELACSIAGTVLLAALIPWWAGRSGAAGAAAALLAAEIAGGVLTGAALAWVAARGPRAAVAAPPGAQP